MMHFLAWLYVALGVMLLFGASVFVHEFGHFWMARRCGLKINGFSIGFGPKILGWTCKGIDYAWRLIPAGGYVALPQMVLQQNGSGETKNLPPVSPGSKILVAISGPVMNVLFAFLIAVAIYFLGLPVPVNPAIIGPVPPGSPEAKMGIRAGDRIVAVNGTPVKSWDQAQLTVALARTNVLPVIIQRQGVRTTYDLTATFNPQIGLKLLNLYPRARPVIAEVLPGSPAEKAGLKPGEEIVSCAAVPIAGPEQLIRLIRKRAGEPTPLEVRRGPESLQVTVTPKADPSTRAGVIGVVITSNPTMVYAVQRPGPPPWRLMGQVCALTFRTVAALLHWRQTGVRLQDLSGPPGILAMLAVDMKADYRLALKFMVLLNISLALFNLLPVPVLDGGHIAFALWEKIRGRPLSAHIQASISNVFAVLIITFMLYVSYYDIFKRLPLFKSILNQPVQVESRAGEPSTPAPPAR
jgi:regulator of sigma E protease